MKPLLLHLCALVWAFSAGAFDHSHAQFTSVLRQHVRGDRVDYAALKSGRGGLDEYLRLCAAVTEPEFNRWSAPEQMAYLINVYNAATLRLVINHYPVKSIKNIGGFFKGPWKQEVVSLFGSMVTLDFIEHGVLRANYDEPRIHFALVCAALGCPPLRTEAFTAASLEEQLEEQGRIFLRTPGKNRVEPGTKTLHLSPIFKWFRNDFTGPNRSVIEFVRPYLASADREALAAMRDWKIRYTDYDWTLNDTERK